MILPISQIYTSCLAEVRKVRDSIHEAMVARGQTMSLDNLTKALDRACWLECQAVTLGYLASAT
jgi:hypothetical protein